MQWQVGRGDISATVTFRMERLINIILSGSVVWALGCEIKMLHVRSPEPFFPKLHHPQNKHNKLHYLIPSMAVL